MMARAGKADSARVSAEQIPSYDSSGNSRSTLAIRNGCLNTNVSRRDRVIAMISLADWPRGAAVIAGTGRCRRAQAPFSSSGESVSIENSIGFHGGWKTLKHPAGIQL